MRYLINPDGAPFEAKDLEALGAELNALDDDQRKKFRNENATAIASHDAPAILIVAGSGTGKSTLFKQRIVHWLDADPTAKILALSFVTKLVADLNADVQTDPTLTDKQKSKLMSSLCTNTRGAWSRKTVAPATRRLRLTSE
jgi:hypothetical protein